MDPRTRKALRIAEETKKQEWLMRDDASAPYEKRLRKKREAEEWMDVTTEVGALDAGSLSDNL